MAHEPPSPKPEYGRARIVVGLGLFALVAFLYIVGRPLDSIQLGIMLGVSALFLGVEGGKWLLR